MGSPGGSGRRAWWTRPGTFGKAALGILLLAASPARGDELFSVVGDVIAFGQPAGAAVATVVLGDRPGTLQFALGYGVAMGTTLLLKSTVDSPRPDGDGNDSFPSGHMANATYGAAFVHRRYGFRYAWPMYLGAVVVGASRVDADRHRPVDVLGGAAISLASAWIFVDPRVTVAPAEVEGVPGVELSLRW